jgi:hypothetical protein
MAETRAALYELIDTLTHNANRIKEEAAQCRSQPAYGPFTKAILHTQLGDLIRDVDPSELGLFTLITPGQGAGARTGTAIEVGSDKMEGFGEGVMADPAIARVEFHGATPLRKPLRKDELHKVREHEPEVYAQAAIKYIDRLSVYFPISL